MTEPYRYEDSDRCTLKVEPVSVGVALSSRGLKDNHWVVVYVRSTDLDELVTAMYSAAGRRVAVLDVEDVGEENGRYHAGWSVQLAADGRVHLVANRDLDPGEARQVATTVLAFASKSEALASEAEIHDLADRLRTWADQDVEIRDGDGRDLARLLLAAGYRKTDRHD